MEASSRVRSLHLQQSVTTYGGIAPSLIQSRDSP
jgi:hypothetical protein